MRPVPDRKFLWVSYTCTSPVMGGLASTHHTGQPKACLGRPDPDFACPVLSDVMRMHLADRLLQ